MRMLLADGKNTIECGCDPSLDPYEMKMSQGVNQSLWHLSGLPHDASKRDLVLRLMTAARGEAAPAGADEALLLRLVQLAFHMEWLLGMIAGPDTHKVLVDDPRAMVNSFKALCLDLAAIEEAPAADRLKAAMIRAEQRNSEIMSELEARWAMEDQALNHWVPTGPLPATRHRIGGF
jgi:hypothetical protein